MRELDSRTPMPAETLCDSAPAWRNLVGELLGFTGNGATLDDGCIAKLEQQLRDIDAILRAEYGSPDLGNKDDPTDEYVYIVLARKTPERAYGAAFEDLKKLGSWAEILQHRRSDIEAAIFGGGLESKKTRAIIKGLDEINRRLGSPDLSRAAHLDDDQLFRFLVSLSEIGPKSALCVMLYGFDRAVFPVDAHVGRVLARLGVFRGVAVDLGPMNHKKRQSILRELVPPDLRYHLHVNLIAHGRTICRAKNPRCESCPLAFHCRDMQNRCLPSENQKISTGGNTREAE